MRMPVRSLGGMQDSIGLLDALSEIRRSWAKARRHLSIVDSTRLVACALSAPRPARPLARLSHRGFGPVFVRPGTSDPFVLEQVLIDCDYDLSGDPRFAAVVENYHRMLRRGRRPLIVDCGANIGLAALYFSTLFPQAKVVAVEPSAENAAVARRNLEGRPHVEVIEAAIHSSAGALTLTDPGLGCWGFSTRAEGAGATVRAVAMNDLLRGNDAERCLIAKIDIEGAERELFAANLEWLDRVDLLIIELHDWLLPGEGSSAAFFAAIQGRRFEQTQRGENLCLFFEPQRRKAE